MLKIVTDCMECIRILAIWPEFTYSEVRPAHPPIPSPTGHRIQNLLFPTSHRQPPPSGTRF